MNLKLKDGSKDIGVTEEQYKKMVETVLDRHFPIAPSLDNVARSEKAKAAVFLGEARFFIQGNFTVAVLVTGGKFFVGATKRNKKDRNKPIFAKMTALSRAIKGALHHYLAAFAGEPVQAPTVAEVSAEYVKDMLKTPGLAAPVQDIPRTMEDVAKAIVYPISPKAG